MRGLGFWVMTLALALFAVPVAAQMPPERPKHIHIQLVAETDTPAAGSEVTLALAATPDSGWHAYWKNPGDAGFETETRWTLPAGVSAGPLVYPVPARLMVSGMMSYVYEGPFTEFVALKLPAGLAPGTALPVALKLHYLVCTLAICVPEDADLSTTLTIGDGAVTPARRAQFDGWRAALPKPLGADAAYQIDKTADPVRHPLPGGRGGGRCLFLSRHRPCDRLFDAGERGPRRRPIGDRSARRSGRARHDRRRAGDRQGGRLRGARGAGKRAARERRSRAVADDADRVRRRGARRPDAQHHALRLPDPQPQGAEPRQGQRRRASARRSARLYRGGDPRLPRTGSDLARAPGGRGDARLGIPAPGPARDPAPAAAHHGDRAQSRRAVRDERAGRDQPPGGARQRRRVHDRRARRVHRDAVHRPVHGRGTRGDLGAALGSGTGDLRRAGAGDRAAIPADRLRPGAAAAAAQAGRVDGHAAPPPLDPDVPHRIGARLGAGAAGGSRRHGNRPGRGAARRLRAVVGRAAAAGGEEPAVAPRAAAADPGSRGSPAGPSCVRGRAARRRGSERSARPASPRSPRSTARSSPISPPTGASPARSTRKW